MGVASLVLGIISIVCGIFTSNFKWIGALLGLIGIILGAQDRKNVEKRGIATAGMVCSIIGFVLCIIGFIACIACIGGLAALGAMQ
jgi:vacuolar-type H+-ATPase subunit I/STV1